MAEKIYINGCFINEYTFQDGGSILKLSVPRDSVDKFCADLKANATERGLTLQITKRKNPAVSQKSGKVYATHTLSVDTYVSNKPEPEDKPW